MKIINVLGSVAAAALFAMPAMAQDAQVYAGVGVDSFEFDAYTLSGRVGANFSDYLGVEGQAGFGIIDDEESFGGDEVSVGIDFFGAAFLTGRFPASEQFDVVGRVGYYYVDAGAEINGNTVDLEAEGIEDSADGLAFGAGGQFNFGEGYRNAVRLEYTYLDGEGGNGDAVSLSFLRRF